MLDAMVARASEDESPNTTQQVDVAVIGAGFAGLPKQQDESATGAALRAA